MQISSNVLLIIKEPAYRSSAVTAASLNFAKNVAKRKTISILLLHSSYIFKRKSRNMKSGNHNIQENIDSVAQFGTSLVTYHIAVS